MKNKKMVVWGIIALVVAVLGVALVSCPPIRCKVKSVVTGCSDSQKTEKKCCKKEHESAQASEKKCCKKERNGTEIAATSGEKTPSENCKGCKSKK